MRSHNHNMVELGQFGTTLKYIRITEYLNWNIATTTNKKYFVKEKKYKNINWDGDHLISGIKMLIIH